FLVLHFSVPAAQPQKTGMSGGQVGEGGSRKKKLTGAMWGRLECGGEERTMRRVLCLLLFVPVVFPASSGQEPARPANASVSGRWVVNTDFYGTTIYFRMELKQEGEKLSGNFDGDKLEGTLKGNSIYLLAKDEQGGTDEGKGTLERDRKSTRLNSSHVAISYAV